MSFALRMMWLLLLGGVARCAPTYRACPESIFANVKKNYSDSPYTNRGMYAMQLVHPPFMNLRAMLLQLETRPKSAVLEHGCGLGRNLMEMQFTAPSVQFFGTNYKHYPFHQATGDLDLLTLAKHVKIPMKCDSNGKPRIPKVFLTESLATRDFQYPVPAESIDLIVSRDALHSGKLTPKQMYLIVPRMLRVLKPGGMAMLHIGYHVELYFPSLANKNFTIMGVLNARNAMHGGRLSFMMYAAGRWGTWGVIMKRCLKGYNVSSFGDCIIPQSYKPPFKEDLSLWQSTARVFRPRGRSPEDTELALLEMKYVRSIIKRLRDYNASGVGAV